ncbi:MAG TPA: hypothetical protein VGG57_03685 [Stellaceae bacterium]
MKFTYGWVIVDAGIVVAGGLLLGAYDWRTALAVPGLLACVPIVAAGVLVQRPPLYVASCAVGAGAIAIAATFRPPAGRRMPAAA